MVYCGCSYLAAPSEDLPGHTEEAIGLPIITIPWGRSKGLPTHTCLLDPGYPQVGTGHLPQPAAPTPVPHGDYTLGSPGPGKALGGVGWSGGLSWSLTFDPGHAGCL